ncbi:MAG: DUF134 domain-containing protein [Spirochaetales bacterium]|nr:DUF134 domain-containing protein [Spirochaetales bacterium]
MPRKLKVRNCRRIEGERLFKPSGVRGCELIIEDLMLDEFEALRLCDYDGLSQIEAAEAMGISRGTVQRLLGSGRKKMVDVLLHQKGLTLHQPAEE